MAGYNKILRGSCVLSAPACSWIFLSSVISYKNTSQGAEVWITLLALATLILSLLVYRRYSPVLHSPAKKTTAVIVFIAVMAALFIHIHKKVSDLTDRRMLPAEISGFIASVEKTEKKRYSSDLYFTTDFIPGIRTSGILVYNGETPPLPGSVIAVHRSAKIISSGDNSFLSGLAREGICYRCIIDDSDITVIKEGKAPWRTRIKEKTVARINAIFPGNSAGLITAVYFGDTTWLPKKILLNFRDAGVLHVLAASGMNIALVASFPLLLIPLGLGRRKALLASLLAAAVYLFITDMPVSLVRAGAMYLFVVINLVLYREKNSFNALYLAGSIMIFFHPWEIFNPGFQLSFGATAGILLFYRCYSESLKMFPGFIAGSLAVTFSAQVFAYPIIFLHMNQFNTIGFITNLAVIPLVTASALVSLAVLGISSVAPAAALFAGKYASMICGLIFSINEYASSLKLNFYTEERLIIAGVMVLLAVPLVNSDILNRLKCAPVFAALIISTVLLKNIQYKTDISFCPGPLNPGFNLSREKDFFRLKIDLQKTDTIDERFIMALRKKNPDIKIIEISETSYHNNTACIMLLNDFAVEECVIDKVKYVDRNFQNFILRLQKENIRVTFRFSS